VAASIIAAGHDIRWRLGGVRINGGNQFTESRADALLDERREPTGLPRLTSCLSNH
jgi:hypothetical protein